MSGSRSGRRQRSIRRDEARARTRAARQDAPPPAPPQLDQSPAVIKAGPYFVYGLVILSLAALALRLYAATNEFWLDEIYVYVLAMDKVHSVTDVFTVKIEHHFLVTLGTYLMGDQMNWVWYRLPSVIAGAGTLAVMALAGCRRMRAAALTVTVAVAAVSYPLVVFSSEARGYAPAAFFSLLMFVFLEAYWRSRSWWHLIAFWSASIIAVLYHPSAICISLALGLWSLVREWRLGGGLMRIVREVALCHLVPFAFIAWLYLAFMRQWASEGGDILPITRVLGETLAVAIGLPMREEFRWWALFFGSALIISSLLVLATLVRSDIWIFYLSALLVAPALMLGINRRSFVYVRYFMVLFPFFYLMLGEALDAVARKFTWARTALIGLCVLMLLGNMIATGAFLRVGRGGYLDAVNFMAANTPQPNITVGGDWDFRNRYPVEFFRKYLPANRHMVYFRHNAWPPEGPDWYLIHEPWSNEKFLPKEVVTVRNRTYRLVASYPVLGLTGMGCHLYRKDSKF